MGKLRFLLPVVLILMMADKNVAATDLENTLLMDLKDAFHQGRVILD